MQASKRTLVIGLGVSGCAAVSFLLKRQHRVTAVDKNIESIKSSEKIQALMRLGLEVLSEAYPLDVRAFDLIIVSPGVPPAHPLYQAGICAGIEVIGEIELACRFIDHVCLGITGSNGKTTTTLLVEHVLNQCRIKAKAVGNIGKPLTEVVDEPDSHEAILVIELSSWQLETMHSQILDAAAIINITPNHLDRHKSMEAYVDAKFRIGRCLKPGKKFILHEETFQKYKNCLENRIITFGYHPGSDIYCDKEKIIAGGSPQFALLDCQKHIISHDIENAMAAFALCREFGVSADEFKRAFFSFKKPPHRIEFVRKCKEVSYFDDSKATSIDPVIKAVNSLQGSVILIAGGVHKGSSYEAWLGAFKQKVRLICAIGQAAEQIKRELSKHIPVDICMTLEEAVYHAAEMAQPGDNVLLSPGCASLDMFRDYEQRGNVFKQIVYGLDSAKIK